MTNQARYEYEVDSAEDERASNTLMKKRAEAGWELVSGSIGTWTSNEGPFVGSVAPWHWRLTYVMYWRKPTATM
jgi:hypothetical protein